MAKLIKLIDRSRTVADWDCPRKRYWNYEFGGKGIVPDTTSLELFLGTTIHDALAAIATFHRDNNGEVDIDLIANAANEQTYSNLILGMAGENEEKATNFAKEQAALVEGLIRGFYRYRWPQLIANFPTIFAIEQESVYTISDNLRFMAKPDLLLENLEGEIVYIEYKSTSTKKEEWINQWDTAVQLHSSIKAVEETLGRSPSMVQIVGLYKGYVAYGKQTSPFCYAYHRKGQPPFSESETRYEWQSGFKKVPTWELEGGIKEWVNGMPDEVLGEQFPSTPPIFIKEDLVNTFFKQRHTRESEISLALSMMEGADDELKGDILDTSFPQRFDRCNPGYGKGCSYRRICHGNVYEPLNEGFTYRVPHHSTEMEASQAKEWEQMEAVVRPGERLKEAICPNPD